MVQKPSDSGALRADNRATAEQLASKVTSNTPVVVSMTLKDIYFHTLKAKLISFAYGIAAGSIGILLLLFMTGVKL